MHASGLVEWRAPHELYLPPSVDRYPEGPHTIDMDVTLRVGLSVALWQAGDSQSAIRELFDACDQDDRGEVSPTHAFEIDPMAAVVGDGGESPVTARTMAGACAPTPPVFGTSIAMSVGSSLSMAASPPNGMQGVSVVLPLHGQGHGFAAPAPVR